MCGIAGYIGFSDRPPLERMAARLRHRGPDGEAFWTGDGLGLAATRLSLLDEIGGMQPFGDGTGRFQIVFNGEIYNHAELRDRLVARGVSFLGRSDTEVILRGFVQDGVEFLDALEGMYALAIVDGSTLYLARDRFGMKPLVYWLSEDGAHLVFASEIKALLVVPSVPRALDPAGLVAWSVFGHTLGGRTLLRGISRLPPGIVLRVERDDRNRLRIHRRAISCAPIPAPPPGFETAAVRLTEMLRRSVAEHRRADHPVALYLSGGVDSTLLAALVPSDEARDLRTFVVSDDPTLPDVELAGRVARHLGTVHQVIRISPDEAVSRVGEAVIGAEEPRAPSVALLSAPEIRRWAKAAICGEGADELFAGYRIFLHPESRASEYAGRLRPLLEGRALAPEHLEETAAALDQLAGGSGDGDGARALYDLLRGELLPNDHLLLWDRGTMAAGLEARMPYLRGEIGAWAYSLPWAWLAGDGVPKRILRECLASQVPAELATAVAAREKLAAPSALGNTHRRLRRIANLAVPKEHAVRHPFRALFPRPVSRMLFDVFCFAFLLHNGELPSSFTIDRLYSEDFFDLRKELARQATEVFRAPVAAPRS